MRVPVAVLALAALSAGPALSATVGLPNTPYVDITMDGASARFLLPAVGPNGAFQGSGEAVLCDGSVLQGRTCAPGVEAGGVLSYGVTGSIFPEITGIVTFTDAGAPSTLAVTFSTLIPVIAGPATTDLSGAITVPASRSGPVTAWPSGGGFIRGQVLGPLGLATAADVVDASVTPDPDAPVTVAWGPITGPFDGATVGGCEVIALAMGFTGLGGGTTTSITGRFDVNEGVPAVPLPATGLLLMGALGLAGVAVRRRRA